MDKKLLGQKIKHLRKLNKFTQEKLAEFVNIDIRQIARIEAGESTPSVDTLLRICKIFSITPNELLEFASQDTANSTLKSDIYDLLSLAKSEQLKLIKKLILAVL